MVKSHLEPTPYSSFESFLAQDPADRICRPNPCFFKAIHGFSRGGQLFRSPWRIGPRLFFNSNTIGKLVCGADWRVLMHRPNQSSRRRRQVFIFVAVIVVEMHGGDEFAQGAKLSQCDLLRAVGEVRVANIKIEAQARQPRFVHKSAKIMGSPISLVVFPRKSLRRVVRVQDQMFEGTESRIALPRIGGFASRPCAESAARTANHPRRR